MTNKKLNYSAHSETLVAVVTHLAMTDWNMRTPGGLANALTIDKAEIQAVLDEFKSLFRKSPHHSRKSGDSYYALQLRHALRWRDQDDDSDAQKAETKEKDDPLEAEFLSALLSFISERVQEEAQTRAVRHAAWIGATAALVVGLVALAPFLQSLIAPVSGKH